MPNLLELPISERNPSDIVTYYVFEDIVMQFFLLTL